MMKAGLRTLLGIVWVIIAGVLNVRAELNVVSLKPHTPARMGRGIGSPIGLVEIEFDKPVELNSNFYVWLDAYIKGQKTSVMMEMSPYDERGCTIRGALGTNYLQGVFTFSLPAESVHEKGNPGNMNCLIEWKARYTNSIIAPEFPLESTFRPYIIPTDLEFTWTGEHLETHPYVDSETGETLTPIACLTEVVPYTTDYRENDYRELRIYRKYPLREIYDAENHVCTYRVNTDKIDECPDTIWLQNDRQYSFKIINVLDVEQEPESYIDHEGNEHLEYKTETEFTLPLHGTTEYDETRFPPIYPLRGRLYYYTRIENGKHYVGDVFFEMNRKTGMVAPAYPEEKTRKVYIHAKKSDRKYELYRKSYYDLNNSKSSFFSDEEWEALIEEFSHHYEPLGGSVSMEFDPNEDYELLCEPMEFCTLEGNFIFSDDLSFPLEVFDVASIHDTITDTDKTLPMYDLYGRRISHPLSGQIFIRGRKKYVSR